MMPDFLVLEARLRGRINEAIKDGKPASVRVNIVELKVVLDEIDGYRKSAQRYATIEKHHETLLKLLAEVLPSPAALHKINVMLAEIIPDSLEETEIEEIEAFEANLPIDVDDILGINNDDEDDAIL